MNQRNLFFITFIFFFLLEFIIVVDIHFKPVVTDSSYNKKYKNKYYNNLLQLLELRTSNEADSFLNSSKHYTNKKTLEFNKGDDLRFKKDSKEISSISKNYPTEKKKMNQDNDNDNRNKNKNNNNSDIDNTSFTKNKTGIQSNLNMTSQKEKSILLNQFKTAIQEKIQNKKKQETGQDPNHSLEDTSLLINNTLLSKIESNYASDEIKIIPPINREEFPAKMGCDIPPMVPNPQNCYWLILIVTTVKHQKRRQALRDTWVSSVIEMPDVCYTFVTGKPTWKETPETLESVVRESEKYGDIMWLNHTENYYSLTEKVFHAFAQARRQWRFHFMLKTDDDSYVRMSELKHWLKKRFKIFGYPHDQCIYAGGYPRNQNPVRRKRNKFRLSTETYPFKTYPPFAIGAGYILSSKCVNTMLDSCVDNNLFYLRLEDVAVGVNLFFLSYPARFRTHEITVTAQCNEKTIICHHLNPENIGQVHRQYLPKISSNDTINK